MATFAALLLIPILCLLLCVWIPRSHANRRGTRLGRIVTWMVAAEMLIALSLAAQFAMGERTAESISLFPGWSAGMVDIGVYYDGATSLMLLLVSFIGFIVSRFSIRYLDGEATQGRYFAWLGFTIGAVSLMVVAGNLLLFFAAWMMTSFGLHHLLLHYRHRTEAHRAAWTKFSISRLGDLVLVAALILTYKTFGTFDFAELFQQAGNLAASGQLSGSHTAIAWLLILGAVTKSAQFPFHTWLPDTLETPTPVSALMHAGIVNAGGYLVIRMSPLLAIEPAALVILALIGGFTACFAGVVMMAQTSVKRSLAYSTVAQMGFMMLQCGLGAFSAAMLHILAHSLYKAYAFLDSGNVIAQAQATTSFASEPRRFSTSMAGLFIAAIVTVIAYAAISFGLGIDLRAKAGGFVLAFILCLALTTWGWRMFAMGQQTTAFVGLIGLVGLCLTYLGSYFVVDALLAKTVPVVAMSATVQAVLLVFAVAGGLGITVFAARSESGTSSWLTALRVHAANGFYIDAIAHRVFGSLVKS